MMKRVKFNNVVFFKLFDKTKPSTILDKEFLQLMPNLKQIISFRKSPASRSKSKVKR